MGLIADWRASRERRHRANRYLQAVLTPIDAAEVSWLASISSDRDRAEQELQYLRRAICLIVAERDALDDQTASDVAHALSARTDGAAAGRDGSPSQWGARFRSYTAAMAVRGHTESPAARLGRVLLESAGVPQPSDADIARSTEIVQSARTKANEALRQVFGVASLPDDVRPSALRT